MLFRSTPASNRHEFFCYCIITFRLKKRNRLNRTLFLTINHKHMKKIIFSLLLLVTTNNFAQEITGHVRTEDKYSIAVRNTITEYLENKFTTFDKAYARYLSIEIQYFKR